MARQHQDGEKSTSQRERNHKIRDTSPYSKNFKCYIKSDEKDLIYKRQMVTKLTRKDLEDKYIELCDENFFIKRQNNELQDKIKELTTKIVRISTSQRSYSSSAILRERTSENISDSSRCTTRMHSSYARPMARSSSLNTVYRRNVQSATPSEGSKSSSSSSSSQRSANNSVKGSNQNIEKGILEISEKDLNNQEKMNDLEKKVEELTEAVKEEREKCARIQMEKQSVESRLSDIDMKKFIMENIEVNRLKRKLDQFRTAVKHLQAQQKEILLEKDKFIESERKRFNNVIEQLNEDNATHAMPSEKKSDLKTALRTIEMLRKQISELEYDKKTLMDQQESLSKLLKEAASHEKETKQSPSHDKSILLETLEQLKTEKAAIENSKNELFNKIRELQDMNDKLVVDLEGLKTMKNLSDGLKNDGSGVGDDTIILLSEENEASVT
ncbi:protein fantom-like [Hermetia illucens]|uniref:protein fantom-like n=1 Tax=Hermetia illucens TaxID=343691 RepID=UPI0018CBF588|nr:protein fantom-like [Hermetia illucens]